MKWSEIPEVFNNYLRAGCLIGFFAVITDLTLVWSQGLLVELALFTEVFGSIDWAGMSVTIKTNR